jgi:transcriptional regulator NrdR family protein
MRCPICNGETKVVGGRQLKDVNRVERRRECKDCLNKFNTTEGLVLKSLDPHLQKLLLDRASR